jgi:hypothetical protein
MSVGGMRSGEGLSIPYDEVVPQVVWDSVEEGQAHFGVVESGVGIGCFGEGDCERAPFQRSLFGLVVSAMLP